MNEIGSPQENLANEKNLGSSMDGTGCHEAKYAWGTKDAIFFVG